MVGLKTFVTALWNGGTRAEPAPIAKGGAAADSYLGGLVESPLAALIATADKPYKADANLIAKIRRLEPLVDLAIRRRTELVGFGTASAEDDATQRIVDAVFDNLTVGWFTREQYAERGMRPYIRQLVECALEYGFSAGEVVVLASRRGIHSVRPAQVDKLTWVRTRDGYALAALNALTGLPEALPEEALVQTVALDRRQGSAWGWPAVWNLDRTIDVRVAIKDGLRMGWARYAAPALIAHVKMQSGQQVTDGAIQAQGSRARQVIQAYQKAVRRHTLIDQLYYEVAGVETEFKPFAAEAFGKGLVVSRAEPHSLLMGREIAASFGLPPFMLGIEQPGGYNVSRAEADVLVFSIWETRLAVEALIEEIVNLELTLQGKVNATSRWQFVWDPVTLVDQAGTAQAQLTAAQARQTELSNIQSLIDMGLIDEAEQQQAVADMLAQISVDIRSAEAAYLQKHHLTRSFPRPNRSWRARVGL